MKRWTGMMVLFFLSGQLSGQTETPKPIAGNQTYALLFQISENFRLSSFEGGLLSLKQRVSEKKARRFGMSLNIHHEDDYDKYSTYPVDSLSDTRRLTTSVVTLNLYYSKLTYLPVKNSIQVYYGFGLTFGLLHNYHVNTQNGSEYVNQNTWSFGPLGVMGVEWFPHTDISISGEYSFLGTISYTRGLFTDTLPGIGEISVKRNGFSSDLNQQSIKLGLSVYFAFGSTTKP